MISPIAAAALLPFALAVGLWVSWSDLKFMRIPNQASVVMIAVWIVVGILVVPLKLWAMGLGLGLAVLVVTFIMNAGGLIGGGDAKFAAAMAPAFIHANITLLCMIYVACSLGALAAHRLLKYVPPFRAATPDWKSWTHKGFPFGTTLSATLIFYLLAALSPLF
jgi:prepilin peptidase CpaA